MRMLTLGLALYFGATSAAAAETCSLKQYASLDMTGVPSRIVVPVSIAGKQYHFLVDTGGAYSLFDPGLADSLGLHAHPMSRTGVEMYSASGRSPTQYADVTDFEIGPIHLDHFDMVLVSTDPAKSGIDGVLAPDFLSKVDLEFDFEHNKLNLYAQDHCAEKVVYWSSSYAESDFKHEGSHIVFRMTLDGHDVEAHLDSGSSLTVLNETVANRVFAIDENSPGAERSTEANSFWPYRYRFKSLSAGGLAVNSPLIYVAPDLVKQAFNKAHSDKMYSDPIYGETLTAPDLILGDDVLSKLHIYISYKEKKLYFTAVDAH